MISIIPCIRKVNRLGRSTCFGFRQKAQSNIKLPRSGSSLSRYLVDWRHSFFSLLGFQSYCSWLSIYSLGRRPYELRRTMASRTLKAPHMKSRIEADLYDPGELDHR